MFITAHLAAGLIIGKFTGNYPPALAGAILIDVDHLVPFIRHKIIFNPKRLLKTIIDPSDPYGDQRNYLHSFLTWAIMSAIIVLIDFNVGVMLSIGYLSHLLLDMLDGSDFHPFYPFKHNLIGPVRYLSKQEMLFTLALFVTFIII